MSKSLGSQRKYVIDLIYDAPDPDETNEREATAGQETLEVANQIYKALEAQGHTVKLFPIDKNSYKQVISNLKGDIVFNQVEEDVLGFEVLKLLEQLGKPVTGVDSVGFALSWQKV